MVLIAIVLLFIQANCDLALPDYMSKIVNNGIQQGGVVSAVPQAVRKSEMLKLLAVMSTSNQLEVVGDYRVVDQNSPDYNQYLKEYPDLANEPIMVLNNAGQAEIDKLNLIMGKAFLAVTGIQQMAAEAQADPAKAAAMAKASGFDLSKLPKGVDIFTLIAKLPAAQREQLVTTMNQRFASMDSSLINQSAVRSVKAEYQALGMNTGRLQSSYILQTGLVMLLIALVSMACTVSVGFLSARTAAGLSRNLRRDLF